MLTNWITKVNERGSSNVGLHSSWAIKRMKSRAFTSKTGKLIIIKLEKIQKSYQLVSTLLGELENS